MRFTLVAVVTFSGAIASSAHAQDRTLPTGFENFEVSSFQNRQVEVAVMTEKSTGHKVNVVKMKNGHMMVLLPWGSYEPLMKGTGPDDMMGGG